MNCKFKFHLQAALHRGAAGLVAPPKWAGLPAVPVGRCRAGEAPPKWLDLPAFPIRRCRAGGSAGLGGPTGGPDEALPNLVGTAGPAGLR